jgi:DNA-binding MarR family transcriptional regulator
MTSTADPRWLSPDEREAWLGLVRVVSRLPTMLDAQLERDAGLSFVEYLVLAMLSERPDRCRRMTELARTTNTSASRLSHIATRLERQGFLQRDPDPADGRATIARLTDAGLDKVVRTAPGHVERVRQLVFDALSGEQVDQLLQINADLLAGVDPDGRTIPTAVVP